jgi:ERCC4-related helicase
MNKKPFEASRISVVVDYRDVFSDEGSEEGASKLSMDERNSYNFFNKYVANENNLSECDYNIANFNRFIEIVKEETAKGDTRPIYIFNFFERLDEATDITPFIEALASLGRQVFIGVSNTCSLERFESDKAQLV